MVNAAHVLGLAMLVGAALPMDLGLLGLWRAAAADPVRRVLARAAAAGAVAATVTGALLFTVNAREYAATGLFQAKMALVAFGLVHAAAQRRLDAASPLRRRLAGAVSLAVWVSVLIAGRLLGYLQ